MKALRQDSARKKDGKSVNFKPERQSWVNENLCSGSCVLGCLGIIYLNFNLIISYESR